MAHDARKAALIAALDRARSQLAVNAGALRDDMDVGRRARRSFARNSVAWLGGAALFGLLLAKIPARTKKVALNWRGRKAEVRESAVKAGLLIGALKIAFDLAKPQLLKWAGRRVADYLSSRARGPRV